MGLGLSGASHCWPAFQQKTGIWEIPHFHLGADEHSVMAEGIGSGNIKCNFPNGETQDVFITNCLYVPTVLNNLISVRALAKKTVIASFGKRCFLGKKAELIATLVNQDMCTFDAYVPKSNLAKECKPEDCSRLQHRQVGHWNNYVISQLESWNLAKGRQMSRCPTEERCVLYENKVDQT